MNNIFWDTILKFDFDDPEGEYVFSTRLASENFWTKNFTEIAILEYKKFMYLAATSNSMVSPSEIIDKVWHLHLVYTQSYNDFCKLLGKQIKHIPSTHNKKEISKFKRANQQTQSLYKSVFGNQPKNIWENKDMYQSLNLEKATYKLRSSIIVGILSFIALIIPFYLLLKPIYLKIGNPDFLIYFFLLILLTFLTLELYNIGGLKKIAKQFAKDSFIYNLHPLELVYLKKQDTSDVINGYTNELFSSKAIKANSNKIMEIVSEEGITSRQHHIIIDTIKNTGQIYYPTLSSILSNKPFFSNTANCMDALKKYIIKSKKFGSLFFLNFGVLSLILMLGLIRLGMGIIREKPITYIFISIAAFSVLIIFYLLRLTKQLLTGTIPDMYTNKDLQKREIDGDLYWDYFLTGATALSAPLTLLLFHHKHQDGKNSGSGNYDSCSSDSSCSSCSSCGGCGGD